MRPSKKDQIIAAAIDIITEGGMAAVTMDAVAAKAGVSKGGLLYHFPTMVALHEGIHEKLAADWEQEMEHLAGGTADEVDRDTRTEAFIRSMAEKSTPAELIVTVHAITTPNMSASWDAVEARWSPPPPDDDGRGSNAFAARLAADGLWIHNANTPTTPAEKARRRHLIDHLVEWARTPDEQV
ncbi:TetR family transcriptional regulator [Corynebacterium mendelii]|uniref:TetR family transcriptional regulator n=1 Tax=Corynebacterium mendelii TaxID=2765362 RepID=A0A939IUL6_9CORY|nr:TetR/AcrR family transcriptional regulator [Corynebacterium mendelii]MBN9645064.1 TetR family transcriptional regulator [Corynebacterium mendelii]